MEEEGEDLEREECDEVWILLHISIIEAKETLYLIVTVYVSLKETHQETLHKYSFKKMTKNALDLHPI